MAENATTFQPQDVQKLGKLISDIIQTRCWEELTSEKNKTAGEEPKSSEDSMAVVYIILVLLLFGASLLILLLKYVRKEKESLRLQRFYDEYMVRRFPSMVVHYDEEGRYLKPKTSQLRRQSSTDLESVSPSVSSAVMTPLSTPCTSPLYTPEGTTSANFSPFRRDQIEEFV
ncbi:hypothetical protein SK128_006366 [Halocaridina rubra]|uniref:Uncharacterized protein n=1 Tax=Halocaridina rubra TaxID=373956 RepID=A0AAN8WJI7_HALRR